MVGAGVSGENLQRAVQFSFTAFLKLDKAVLSSPCFLSMKTTIPSKEINTAASLLINTVESPKFASTRFVFLNNP